MASVAAIADTILKHAVDAGLLPLWCRCFARCSVLRGPGAEHLFADPPEPEVWAVWRSPKNLAFGALTNERRWLTGKTAMLGAQADGPQWAVNNQALYSADVAAALVLMLEDDYPSWHLGALRLK